MQKLKRVGNAVLWCVMILATAIVLLIIFYLSTAHADEIHLPSGITCELIREKVAEHGRLASFAWAIRNGYSFEQIRQAKRCLKRPAEPVVGG